MAWFRKAAMQPTARTRRKRGLETLFAVLGAIVTATTTGFVLWKGVVDRGAQPSVEISVVRVQPQGDVYLAEIEAYNSGDATAASVEVEGTLEGGGEASETASTTFDYLPSHSRRRGGLYFSRDPRSGNLTLRPKSYVSP